ncbi:hypothetical protein ACTXJ9_14045 [Brachybacterium tyrofermentans]|uniref:hypothetical protein n=1 Tax=Brachybacterium tyrofermentans TaxID=47848 RepID=UPI003FD005BC
MARTQPATTFYPIPTEIDPEQAHDEAVDTAPWADGEDDTTVRTVPMDGGSAHVEHFPDGHAELVVRIGTRVAAAMILSKTEAEQIGWTLCRPEGYTVTDAFNIHERLYPEAVTP